MSGRTSGSVGVHHNHYHQPSPSKSSISSASADGMAMNWVLDHVLTHPTSYDSAALPLRTIYTLNSIPHTSPTDFKLLLMQHLAKLPSQPCTLPPPFLATFISKCFPKDLNLVDFDQALTALDYMRDLDIRRRKELEKAIHKRGMEDPKVIALRARATQIDIAYAKAIVGIRRMTFLHELSLTPFNKFNCIAILNTLYPLGEADLNAVLSARELREQRNRLWRYIGAVEKNGPTILASVQEGPAGWRNLSDIVNTYVDFAVDQIQRAEDLSRPTSFGSFSSESSTETETPNRRTITSRKSHGQLRRGSADSSESEYSGNGKRSTLERLVKGLTKMTSSKKLYNNGWNGSDEDVKTRFG